MRVILTEEIHMCSSPKSSRAVSASKPIKAFGEDLSKEQRLHFTEVANRADERRKKRVEEKRRWEQKHNTGRNKQQQTSVWQWLNNFFASLATR
ncbi:hypothetical protein ACT3S9_16460 [Pseudoalteromonas sp. AOP31-A2-14]|uniref:hypothetical protein n=2 Tax=Pseudoalteromonas TaxID=53246 RepID=UPI004037094F